MTISIDTIARHLEASDVRFERRGEHALALGFQMRTYRDLDGHAVLRMTIEADEDGRHVRVAAPFAFRIEGDNAAAAIETCLRFQWSFRLVRLEYDPTDGEVRPTIHLPVYDGTITLAQLQGVIGIMGGTCDQLYPALASALESGVAASFDDGPSAHVLDVVDRLAELSPEELELLIQAVRSAASPDDGDREVA